MPGPKKSLITPMAGDGQSIITAVAPPSDIPLELPSVEGFRSERKRKVMTPEGPGFETEYYWTKKGLSEWLSRCPKVPVYVPLDPNLGEVDASKARPLPVYIDGFRIDVPKGETRMVALPVAQIIEQMQEPYRTAQSTGIDLYRIDPDNPNDRGLEIPALAAVAG